MEQHIRSTAAVLPCYGLLGWSGLRMIGDWESENNRLVTAGLAHGAPDGPGPMLQVLTTARDPHADVASLRMAASGQPTGEHDFLRRQGKFDAEGGESVTIKVDSVDVDFTVWRDEDCWWAAGQHHERGLVLEGCCVEVDDVALERVYNLEPYIAGRRAHLRELRGEA